MPEKVSNKIYGRKHYPKGPILRRCVSTGTTKSFYKYQRSKESEITTSILSYLSRVGELRIASIHLGALNTSSSSHHLTSVFVVASTHLKPLLSFSFPTHSILVRCSPQYQGWLFPPLLSSITTSPWHTLLNPAAQCVALSPQPLNPNNDLRVVHLLRLLQVNQKSFGRTTTSQYTERGQIQYLAMGILSLFSSPLFRTILFDYYLIVLCIISLHVPSLYRLVCHSALCFIEFEHSSKGSLRVTYPYSSVSVSSPSAFCLL